MLPIPVALGGFLMGFDASVISGVVGFIGPEFDLTKIQVGWAVASLTLTSTLAMMVSGPVSDHYGRKPVLKAAALLFTISAVASAIAPDYLTLVTARMLGVEAIPAILYFFALFSFPESPRWLVMHNQGDKALGIMERVSGQENAREDLAAVQESLDAEAHKEKVSLKELFLPAMRLVLTIGVVIAILQQITGINSVFFYAPMIFKQSGIGTDAAFMQAVLVGIVNLVATIVAILLIDRLGRRPLIISGLIIIASSMMLLAYGFGSADVASNGELINMSPTLILVGILSFVAGFGISLGRSCGYCSPNYSPTGSVVSR